MGFSLPLAMRFLSATQLFNGNFFLDADAVLVLDEKNNFVEIASEGLPDISKVERYEGIICPGFVNAHCHLELSYLINQLKQKTGFAGFAFELMEKRFKYSSQEIENSILEAVEQMWNSGIVAVGDISNTVESFRIKSKSKIAFHTFIELIAFNPALAEKVITAGKDLLNKTENHTATLTPHAPYSVSAGLMQKITEACKDNLPLSIHNQESAAENEFFEKGTGKVVELYKNLNIDISYYEAAGISSIKSYLKYLPLDKNLILVHNTFTKESDIQFAEAYSKNIFWCLCPNANLYIENVLPDVNLFLKNNCKMVIGTDSLASNHHLSVLEELNTLLRNFDSLPIHQLLTWATSNGASALNMSHKAGTFIPGQNTGLNLIRLNNNEFSFIQKLA